MKPQDLISKQQKINTALLLLASHAELYKIHGDDFWGTEDDVNLGNATYDLISDIVGEDINEMDEWDDFSHATTDEIIQGNKECLIKFAASVIPEGKKLFVVAFESLYQSDEWESRVLASDGDVEIQLWTEIEIGEGRGWVSEELDRLNGLEPGDALELFSDHAHSIYRLA